MNKANVTASKIMSAANVAVSQIISTASVANVATAIVNTQFRIRDHIFHVFAGRDNSTLDIGRILWAGGVIVFCILSFISLYRGQVFDPIAWGTGFAGVLAGGGAALGLKAKTEPDAKE